MPKQIPPDLNTDVIIKVPLEDVMPASIMPYAEHVILERALPRVEDGLKPVQRRILYTMQELGLTPDKPHRKCARIVGDCLGKYHPHGDSSVYDALVRMAQPYSMRALLVDGHGNFGSIDGDSAAAMRYTEARMAPLAQQMLRDIEKDTVPFRLNFDDTLKEPDLLPARYPNLLVNGASGIAVGLATNIPPHNLREAINAVCVLIDNENATTDDLMRVMPAPDFPTGGILIDTPELRTAYETGKGKLTLRARVTQEKGAAGRTLLVIQEVPYMVNKAQMLEKILKLSEEKKQQLGGIFDIRDESDRTGMRAVIELKKDADIKKILAYLYKYSDLQVTFGVNLFAIADGKPQLMGIRTVLQYYIAHQKNVVTRRTKYDLDQARARAHILQGLMIAVDNLDEVIALIRGSKSGKEAKEKLMARFALTDVQAQAILDLRLQRLTGLEILALKKEYADLLKKIDTLEGILKSEKKLLAVIKKELLEIAGEYGDDRRTTIVHESAMQEAEVPKEESVPDEATVVLTRGGLLRRYFPKNFDKLDAPQNDQERPRFVLRTDTAHSLLFLTNHGNCYALAVSALNECRPRDRGVSLSGVLAGLEDKETCISLLLSDLPDELLLCTAQGMVKRLSCADLPKRGKTSVFKLKGGDTLLSVSRLSQDQDVLMVSAEGMAIRFAPDDVPQQGRAGGGVIGMKLPPDGKIILCHQLSNQDEVLLMSERGYGKSILGAMFDRQARAGKGARCFPMPKSKAQGSYLAGAVYLDSPRELTITLHHSGAQVLHSHLFPVGNLADPAKPMVIAILDDIVENMEP